MFFLLAIMAGINKQAAGVLGSPQETIWNKRAAYSFVKHSVESGVYHCIGGHNRLMEPPLSQVPRELFSSMVILHLLVNLELDEQVKNKLVADLQCAADGEGCYSFFAESTLLPADADCTALSYDALLQARIIACKDVFKPLIAMIKNVNREGIIEVYFNQQRHGRIDPVVCANVLYLVNLLDKRDQAMATEEFLYRILQEEAYSQGTRYYPSEYMFFYMVARLLDFPLLREKFAPLLTEKLLKMPPILQDPLDLAIRIICLKKLGLAYDGEAHQLASLQQADGGWPLCAFFKKGRSEDFFGSREIVTAFTIKALT
jgi:hypothetical protein